MVGNEATVTLRVSADLKRRIETVSKEVGISQSAVWKVLIARYIRPAVEEDLQGVLLQALAPRPPGAPTGARPADAPLRRFP